MPSEDMLLLQEVNSPADASKREFLNGAHVRPKEQKDSVEASGDLSSWFGQQIPFNSLLASGALVKKSDGTYGQGAGYTMGKIHLPEPPT